MREVKDTSGDNMERKEEKKRDERGNGITNQRKGRMKEKKWRKEWEKKKGEMEEESSKELLGCKHQMVKKVKGLTRDEGKRD